MTEQHMDRRRFDRVSAQRMIKALGTFGFQLTVRGQRRYESAIPRTVERLHRELKAINEALWEIEDDIRDKERVREFDERFIELARAVYFTNDRRSEVKKKLNLHLGSQIVEEKSYQDYT